jgi:nanoRNase/pAp phosphatase (c-di-AMP/oligoRNAs hydrolase)
MHLAGSQSDIVLLLGFDWQSKPKNSDRLSEHVAQNYRTLVKQAIVENSQVQWVLVDHPEQLMDELNNVSNITCDTLEGVLNTFYSL